MPFDSDLFEAALKDSCLDNDLSEMTQGVNTETGDCGSALSEGQRTRLALARVLYQRPDIYLLDVLLSSLDSSVGSHVMDQTIRQVLRGQTVILVTHAVQYLSRADRIYLMDEGAIVRNGTFSEIRNCDLYQQFETMASSIDSGSQVSPVKHMDLVSPFNQKQAELTSDIMDATLVKNKRKNSLVIELMIAEERESRGLSLDIVGKFINKLGGVWVLGLVLLLAFAEMCFTAYGNVYLANWSMNFKIESSVNNLLFYIANSAACAILGGSKIAVI